MHRTPTALAFTSLALILASCGGPSTPNGSSELVQLKIGRASAFASQGMPTGGFDPSSAFLKVKVADSKGQPVAFNNGVYAPNGQGDTFLTLNLQNNFGTTVLLPKGEYTFETIAKDGVNDQATTGTLLAYSKTNLTPVDASHNSVKLTVRTVMNTEATALNFKLPTDVVYTNDLLDLRLNVKTNSVGDQAYSVPTTDFSIGQYVATNGTLTSVGSKLGVNVLATGTTADPRIAVTVPVTGLVQTGAEIAAEQTVNVTFEHAVNASTVTADVLAPTATLSTTAASLNSTATLTGTASDENGAVSQARLYDGTTLIASTDASEQNAEVKALTFPNGDSNWTASWTPTKVGEHELTFMTNDAAGNETQVTQAVTVKLDMIEIAPASDGRQARLTLAAGETRKILYKLPETMPTDFVVQQYMINAAAWDGDFSCETAPFEFDVTAVDAATGQAVDLPMQYYNCYKGTVYQRYGEGYGQIAASRSLIFTVTNITGHDIEVNPYFTLQTIN
ncbi:hypothetical protein [Deinococcus hohokamensis]|uniref:Bacterial Ig-like domain-containing protein n=1 Tax=Deinococcus hohokamensis TaxID=309883 RepID=A0ABV9ICV3_9DEIO